MKAKKWLMAAELVRTQPGAAGRRREIILALCQGRLGMMTSDPELYGSFIVKVANRILEKTEQ